MTTDIELFLSAQDEPAARQSLQEVEAFFRSVEARFSRFLGDSELSRLNALGIEGSWVHVSAELAGLVGLARQAAADSDGVFDPTIIDALEIAGYDRSIDLIRAGRRPAGVPRGTALTSTPWGRWRTIEVTQDASGGCSVRLAPGLRLDLGGIAKGWAADQAAAMLIPLGEGLVNAGGDLRAWGHQPGAEKGRGWLAAVEDPRQPGQDLAWLDVLDRAAATSTITRRRWAGGHHLIDPRTGRPAETDLLSVTALGPTAARAEVAAKVALILGRDAGLRWLSGQDGIDAMLVGAEGKAYGTPGIEAFFG